MARGPLAFSRRSASGFYRCYVGKQPLLYRLILLRHRLVRLIRVCCSLGYVVRICFFSVFALTVFQSSFLRNGNVVFFSDIILFIVSTFIYFSCVSVCSVFECSVSITITLRRRKWTRRHEFKSWTRLIAFHIALIPLGKVWIQLFSLQLWVNSRAD